MSSSLRHPSRIVPLAVLAAATLAAAAAPAATVGATHRARVIAQQAPADRYFGPQKTSAIGVRMQIDALGRRLQARTIADADLVHDAGMLETSFEAWAAAYPHDAWLSPTALHLEELLGAVQSTDARAADERLLRFTATALAATPAAHLSRLRLAQGFPPLHAETAVTATANPYAAEAARGAAPAAAAAAATVAVGAVSPAPGPIAAGAAPPAAR